VASDAEHDAGGDEPVEAGSFAGLADLDEDLRTMSQSHAEVERWRRLSTRGRGSERPPAHEGSEPGGLAAPIVDASLGGGSGDPHAATTAPGTLTAPTPVRVDPDKTAKLPSVPPQAIGGPTPRADADTTAKLPSIPPEAAAEITKATRKSFAPPKDTPSAPPGSRVVLPSTPPVAVRPSSKPPPRVPRPTPRPREEDEAEDLRGWRPSDPDAVAPVPRPGLPAIPPPAMAPAPAVAPAAAPARTPSVRPPATPSTPPPAPEAPPTPLTQPIALTPATVGVAVLAALLFVSLAAWWIWR
jgi:hypothetical protein